MNDSSSATTASVSAVVGLLVYALYAIALWRIFRKAGYHGWLALIPIVNAVYFVKVGGRSGWFVLLYLVPLVNIVVHYLVGLWVARSFGHGHGYAIGLFLLPLVFAYVLAFDGSRHHGADRDRAARGALVTA